MKNTVIIGERYQKYLAKPLADLSVDVLWMCDNPYIDHRLAGHVDLSAIRLGKNIVASKHIERNPIYVKKLAYMGYEVYPMQTAQGKVYPDDAGLCACIIRKYLIHNLSCTDSAVLEAFKGEKIHVNQGYSKCSCCVVDDGALITADEGIERTMLGRDIEILKINHGGITLGGFEYGFIGGASITLDEIILFTGELADKRDKLCVEAFVRNRGKYPVYLTHSPAFDIGSAVVL